MSRIKRYKADNEDMEVPLPDLGDASYLMNLLSEAGMISQTGMGIAPLTWTEIRSWLECTQLELSTWELITLREMSCAYAGEYSSASDKSAPPPYTAHVEEIDRAGITNKIQNLLRARMSRKDGPKYLEESH